MVQHLLDFTNSLCKRNKMSKDYAVLPWMRHINEILSSTARDKSIDFKLAGNIGPIQAGDASRVTEAVVAFVDPEHDHSIAAKKFVAENLKPANDLYRATTKHGSNVGLYGSGLARARAWSDDRARFLKHSLEYNLSEFHAR